MIDKSRARKEGGAGLGMTLCSRIIGTSSCKMENIQSDQEKGTVIAIQFHCEGEEMYDKEDLEPKACIFDLSAAE